MTWHYYCANFIQYGEMVNDFVVKKFELEDDPQCYDWVRRSAITDFFDRDEDSRKQKWAPEVWIFCVLNSVNC